jgi:hypothetical protein
VRVRVPPPAPILTVSYTNYTDVPESDIKKGRATPALQSTNGVAQSNPLQIKCSSGLLKPKDAFAAVKYHDQ